MVDFLLQFFGAFTRSFGVNVQGNEGLRVFLDLKKMYLQGIYAVFFVILYFSVYFLQFVRILFLRRFMLLLA